MSELIRFLVHLVTVAMEDGQYYSWPVEASPATVGGWLVEFDWSNPWVGFVAIGRERWRISPGHFVAAVTPVGVA